MSTDLFNAILAMDAYNRGYGAGINFGPGSDTTGTPIGTYTVYRTKGDETAQNAGFYAIAYQEGGSVTISYRGTDNPNPLSLSNDIWSGWGVGAGSPEGTQAALAFKFYDDITGKNGVTNISLTGHSLGGGLAGLVGAIKYVPVAIYDNMAFQAAAQNTYEYALNAYNGTTPYDVPLENPIAEFLRLANQEQYRTTSQRLLQDIYGGQEPTGPMSIIGSTAYYVLGEFLSINRPLQSPAPTQLYLDPNIALPGVDEMARHSISLLVVLKYAEDNATSGQTIGVDWKTGAKYFIPKLYDDTIASLSGADAYRGTSTASEVMRDAIAYSAIDVGATVFGSTGIKALFDDATDLGKAFAVSLDSPLESFADEISNIFVQFAGQLAIRKVEVTDTLGAQAIQGVLTYSENEGLLSVSFAEELWSIKTGIMPSEILARRELVTNLLGEGAILDLGGMTGVELAEQTETATFALTNDDVSTTVSENTNPEKYALFVSGDGDDSITGSAGRDFISGGAGDDVINGGDGEDILVGAAGDDTFTIGVGKKIIGGGEGTDTLDISTNAAAGGVGFERGALADEVVFTLPGQNGGGLQDVDTYSIEKVKFGSEDNYIRLDSHSLPDNLEIDGGAGTDMLDLSGLKDDAEMKTVIDENGNKSLAIETDNGTITLKNIEKVQFGEGDVFIDLQEPLQEIHLGSGDAAVRHAASGTQIYVSSGHADIAVSDNVQIVGAKPTDNICSYGNWLILNGGLRWVGSESPWAYNLFTGARFGINIEGDLVVKDNNGSQLYIANYVGGPGVPYGENTAGIYIANISTEGWMLVDPSLPSHWLESQFQLVNALAKAYLGVQIYRGVDPLVLDLNGDGVINTMDVSATAPKFDLNGTGFAVSSGWVLPGDGFLVADKNDNGTVDDIGELFGSATEEGFAVLAEYDLNEDGVVNAVDPGYSQLRVWRDLNGNHAADAGEMQTLAEAGIASISTAATAQSNTFVSGNQILALGSFTRTDSTTGLAADVAFHVDNMNTTYLGDTSVSGDASYLPNLKGYGTLTDLRVAMAHDPALTDPNLGPTLISVVNSALPNFWTLDLEAMRNAATPILTAWARAVQLPDENGVLQTVAPTGHADFPLFIVSSANGMSVSDFAYQVTDGLGTYWQRASGQDVLDSQNNVIARPTFEQVMAQPLSAGTWWISMSGEQIDFLERYTGDKLPIGNIPENPAAVIAALQPVLDLFYDTLSILAVGIASQGPLAGFFDGVAYDAATNTFKATTTDQLAPMYKAIFSEMPSDAEGVAYWLSAWKPLLDIVIHDFAREQGLSATYGFRFANIVAAYEEYPLALSITDVAVAMGIPAEQIIAGTGNLTGTNSNDIFYISGGNQTITGLRGPDNYVVGSVFDGTTIIDDEPPLEGQYPDILRFASLKSTDVLAQRDGIDLIITDTVTNQSLRIVGQFTGYKPGLMGTGNLNDDCGVTQITFADGVVWDVTDMAWAVSPNTDGVDGVLNGTWAIDVLDSARGNHTLSGGNSGDIYLFGRGNGAVTIQDEMDYILNDVPDALRFGEGISISDLTFARQGDSMDLVIGIKDSPNDTLTLKSQFEATFPGVFDMTWFDRIESFIFADGTRLSWDDVQNILIKQAAQTAGTDIYGFDTADTIKLGTAGGHFVSGGNGDDTYYVGGQSGDNTIFEGNDNLLSGMDDTIVFDKDIDPANVQVVRDGDSNDVSLILSPTSTLTLEGQFDTAYALSTMYFNRIETFKFQDEAQTIWTYDDIKEKAIQSQVASGATEIYGFEEGDIIDTGPGGDQYISGLSGPDTYVFGLGYGHDRIYDDMTELLAEDGDRILFNPDVDPSSVTFERGESVNDLVIRLADGSQLDVLDMFGKHEYNLIETLEFQDSAATILTPSEIKQIILNHDLAQTSSTIYGFNGGATLDGYGVNNTLVGLNGNFTFVFGIGYGQETIRSECDQNPLDANFNTLRFGPGITPSMLVLSRTGSDVTIGLVGYSDTLTLEDQFDFFVSPDHAMIQRFEFADETVWDLAAFEQALMAAQLADPNCTDIYGYSSNDTLIAGSGNNTLHGGTGNDILDGGAGNDTLLGEKGNDTYIFGRGYGEDTITTDQFNGGQSALVFNADVAPSDIVVSRSGYDLVLSISGTTDKVTVKNGLGSTWSRLSEIRFANSTVWNFETVVGFLLTGTPGDDMLIGTSGANVFDGGAGNDTMEGNGGADTYVFGRGYGQDIIDDVHSTMQNPLSVILLNADVSPSDVTLKTMSNFDLVLSINGTTDQLTVKAFFGGTYYRPESIRFADGTVWDYQTVLGMALTGTPGDDGLYGDAGDNIFDGGAGNDMLKGNNGNDTYIFGRGYGQDTIDDIRTYGSTKTSSLVFNSDVAPSDIIVMKYANNLVLSIDGTTDRVTIKDYYVSVYNRPSTIQFSDGTTWDYNAVNAKILVGTSGADTLVGDETITCIRGLGGNDVLTAGPRSTFLLGGSGTNTMNGGAGDDEIYSDGTADKVYGNGGNDIIVSSGANTSGTIFNGGEGYDTLRVTCTMINSATITDIEKLEINSGVSLSMTAAQFSGFETIAASSAGTATITGLTASTYDLSTKNAVGTINIAGYTGNDTIIGNAASQTLTGNGGNDTLDGRGGDDLLVGGTGNDIFVFGLDYGADTVSDTSGTADKVSFADSLSQNNLWFSQSGNNLLVNVLGTNDSLTVKDWYVSSSYRVESFTTTDTYKLDSQLAQLVSAMATYAANNPGFDPMTATAMPTDTTLQTAIAASWHT